MFTVTEMHGILSIACRTKSDRICFLLKHLKCLSSWVFSLIRYSLNLNQSNVVFYLSCDLDFIYLSLLCCSILYIYVAFNLAFIPCVILVHVTPPTITSPGQPSNHSRGSDIIHPVRLENRQTYKLLQRVVWNFYLLRLFFGNRQSTFSIYL